MPFTFSKEERLCSRKTIEHLYSEGNRMMAFPYSVQWMVDSGQWLVDSGQFADASTTASAQLTTDHRQLTTNPCQVLIVAPKRRFHHAVDRNRVKRLTRECWRRTKPQLYDFLAAHGLHLSLSLVYIHNEIMPYDKLLQRMEKLVQQLEKEITTATEQ